MGQHHGAFRIVAMLMITGQLLSSTPAMPSPALALPEPIAAALIGPVAPAAAPAASTVITAPALRPRGIPPGSFVPASLRATPHTRFSLIPPPAEPSSPLLKFVNSAASSEETSGEGGGEHHPAFYANDDNPSTS
jgi:hypothetical protein